MELLNKLHKLGVQLDLVNNDVKVKAPKGVLTPELINAIKAEKNQLISLLSTTTHRAIPKAAAKEYYPLTSSQKRIWVLSQFEGGNNAYNIPGVFELTGTLHKNTLKEAFRYLIARHDSLRIQCAEIAGQVVQQVVPIDALEFHIETKKISADQEQALIEAFYKEEFDLSVAPLLKARVLQTATDRHVLLFGIHHIIGDGWSMEVFVRELMQVYNQLIDNQEITLPSLAIQYPDYVMWSQQAENTSGTNLQEAYWLSKFSGALPVLELPSNGSRPLVKTYKGATILYRFSKEFSESLQTFNKSQGVTLYMSLLSGINGLFYRYTNSTDIILGTPIAGRSHPDLENQIGLYLNTLAIRTTFEEDISYSTLLAIQKATLLEAYQHQDYPFDELVEKLAMSRDTSRSALFDVLVVLQNQREVTLELSGVDITPYNKISREISQFDMTFSFSENESEIALRLEYNTDLYNDAFITQMCIHLESFLRAAITNPEQSIDLLDYLSVAEKTKIVETFNDTSADFPKKTVIDLFKEQVVRQPNAVAIVYEGKEITYQEVEYLSNALANQLLDTKAIGKETLIGVQLDRSDWLIVSILAILKTGGAYVPIDPSYPEERIAYITQDSQCVQVIDSDYISAFISNDKVSKAPQIQIASDQLAYVIYTSGSTGQPKGVMIEHKSLTNLCVWHQKEYELDQNSRSTMYASVAFDASVWEIFPYLCFGGTLFPITHDEVRLDLENISSFLAENVITHCYLPPKITSELINNNLVSKEIKILSGGEALKVTNALDYSLYNNYGPTENTVVTTQYKVEPTDILPLPIGKPIDNTQIYILSAAHQLQPIGIIGELCVSGCGLARGYANRPELTREQFINHPFQEGERLYKTGDLARWLPDGNIEFIGRKDYQVQLRGYRIELGEIEHVLVAQQSVKQAVVDVVTIQEDPYLVAYVVNDSTVNKIDKESLKKSLRKYLPAYMIPGYFIELNQLPLTSNGKVDRKSLPKVEDSDITAQEYVAPVTDTEKKLVTIWEEVLGVQKVGVTDNFFELGGHSLKVTQLINKINKELSATIKVKEVFTYPTIAALSEKISDTVFEAIPKAEAKEHYPLTSSQKRLWVLSQFEGGNNAYNIPGVFELIGTLHKDTLEEAFRYIITRHASLRTKFTQIGDEVVQQIVPIDELEFFIETKQISADSGQQHKQEQETIKRFYSEEFDLSLAPLVKAMVLQTDEERSVLLFSIHHIIGDGWSMEVFVKEMLYVYHQLSNNQKIALPELEIQYQDYVMWKQAITAQETSAQEAYWISKFSGELPLLELPTEKARPIIKTYNGATHRYHFSKELSESLHNFCTQHEVTLYMSLLAGLNSLLYRYTNTRDIIIGTPVAGRAHPDLENQIGLYLNTLAIRTQFEEGLSFEELITVQKETLLEAYQYQDYPFDQLVDTLNIVRDTSRSALFDVMVVLQNQQDGFEDTQIEGLAITPYTKVYRDASQFDMTFSFSDDADGIKLRLEYNTDIYEASFVSQLCIHLDSFIRSAISNPLQQIETIDYLSEEETHQLLHTFTDTVAEFPKDTTIIDIFRTQVERTPNAIAIVYDDTWVTYQELEDQSNALANSLLRSTTIDKETLIGVQLDRSEWLIISLLAVLKTGAGYVPLDPAYPEERIAYIKHDSQCVLIIDLAYITSFISSNKEPKAPEVKLTSEQLAYIIYTSGSTGKPKGVMIEHRNVSALIHWAQREFESDDFEIAYFTTSHCFDLSVYEMFYPLSIGKKVRVLENGLEIPKYLQNDQKVLVNTVPSVVQILINEVVELSNVTILNMAGEVIPPNFSKALPISDIAVRNLYGPSEDTTYSTSYLIQSATENSISIGGPIDNTQVYILSAANQLQPVGIIGELCVSGDGLARGYLKRPELTNEKFINHPFQEGERLYKTGDLARWLPDGTIEFIGRKDHQVKFRGYRIELGEIEHALVSQQHIRQAIVDVVTMQEDMYLVAYLVSDSAVDTIDKDLLQKSLRKYLPAYMIPGYFIELDQLPLTPNGKVDRKSLPTIETPALTSREYIAPATTTEKKLAAIWEEVLSIEKVGVTDNFFELGGNSLNLIKLKNRCEIAFNKNIQWKDFFQYNTVASQAKLVAITSGTNTSNPIQKAPKEDTYPLSSSQLRFWMLSQLNGGSNAYNITETYRLTKKINISLFKQAIKQIIDKHEILRTSFETVNGVPRQRVHALEESKPEDFFDEVFVKESEWSQIIDNTKEITFDLNKTPLFRITLLNSESDASILIVSFHHILVDAWSFQIIFKELIQTYQAIQEKQDFLLPPLSLQYKDFAYWQQNHNKQIALAREFWLQQFSDEVPKLEFATTLRKRHQKSFNGATKKFCIPEQISAKLKQDCIDNNVTMFTMLMAYLNVLISRYTSSTDIVIGTPISLRDHKELEDQIGCYLNTLPLRFRFSEHENFQELLENVQRVIQTGISNKNYPFEDLVKALKLPRDRNRNPLFDILMVYQEKEGKASENVFVEKCENDTKSAIYDLTFHFNKIDSEVRLEIHYCTDLFSASFVEQLGNHLLAFMDTTTSATEIKIGVIDYLSEEEKVPYTSIPQRARVCSLLESYRNQCLAAPTKTILVNRSENMEMDYQTLDRTSDELAQFLNQEYHITSGDKVVVKLANDHHLVVTLIALLKLQAVYVPIDPVYPEKRQDLIIKDSQAKLVIDATIIEKFHHTPDSWTNQPYQSLPDTNDLLYIIYTSGSTGTPKGIMMPDSVIGNLIEFQKNSTSLQGKRVLQFTSIGFDVSIQEILYSITTGTTLYSIPASYRKDSTKLIDFIKENAIDILFLPTSLVKILLKDVYFCSLFGDPINHIITAGEKLILPENIMSLIGDTGVTIHNQYGPAETHVVSAFEIDKNYNYSQYGQSPPIGTPIDNSEMYVLDTFLNPVAKNIVQEIYLGGNCISNGYLNLPALNKERFIQSPFVPGENIYKTGDLGYVNDEGELIYVNRVDNMLKVNGYRVEPVEIERAATAISEVDFAAVHWRTINTTTELILYFESTTDITENEIRILIAKTLPLYMVPKYILRVDKIATNSNGKVDTSKLPVPTMQPSQAIEEIVNDTEKKLQEIFVSILESNAQRNSNFFELGGSSLNAITLIGRIHQHFDVRLRLEEVFEYPTIKDLAAFLNTSKTSGYTQIKPAATQNDYPLTPVQSRFWQLQQSPETNSHYNICNAVLYEGEVDETRFEEAYQHLVQKHSALRTVFKAIEGQPRQHITSVEAQNNFQYIDLSHTKDKNVVFHEILASSGKHVFNLEQANHQCILIKYGVKQYYILVNIHHIVADLWSLKILFTDLFNNYQFGYHPNENEMQLHFHDYVVWHLQELKEKRNLYENYWLGQFGNDQIPTINLPYSYPEIENRSATPYHHFAFNEEESKKLDAFVQKHQVSMYSFLLSAVYAFLHRITGDQKMIIGAPVAGRSNPQVENIVGLFINVIPFLYEMNENDDFVTLIQKVHKMVLSNLDHQEYPLGDLITHLQKIGILEEDAALFDVTVVLQNIESQEHLKDYQTKEIVSNESHDNLSFLFAKKNECLNGTLEYRPELFEPGQIVEITENFKQLIIQLVSEKPESIPSQEIHS